MGISAISEEFKRFQDPSKSDKLTKALEEVKETNAVLHDSIKKLLERQGDLDKLVDKSNEQVRCVRGGIEEMYHSAEFRIFPRRRHSPQCVVMCTCTM